MQFAYVHNPQRGRCFTICISLCPLLGVNPISSVLPYSRQPSTEKHHICAELMTPSHLIVFVNHWRAQHPNIRPTQCLKGAPSWLTFLPRGKMTPFFPSHISTSLDLDLAEKLPLCPCRKQTWRNYIFNKGLLLRQLSACDLYDLSRSRSWLPWLHYIDFVHTVVLGVGAPRFYDKTR